MKKSFLIFSLIFSTLIVGFIACEKAEMPVPEAESATSLTAPSDGGGNEQSVVESREDAGCITCQVSMPSEGIGTNISSTSTATIFFNYWVDQCFERSCPKPYNHWTNIVPVHNVCIFQDFTNQYLGGVLYPNELPIVMNKIGCFLKEHLPSSNHWVKSANVVVYDLPLGGRCMSIYVEYGICTSLTAEPDPGPGGGDGGEG